MEEYIINIVGSIISKPCIIQNIQTPYECVVDFLYGEDIDTFLFNDSEIRITGCFEDVNFRFGILPNKTQFKPIRSRSKLLTHLSITIECIDESRIRCEYRNNIIHVYKYTKCTIWHNYFREYYDDKTTLIGSIMLSKLSWLDDILYLLPTEDKYEVYNILKRYVSVFPDKYNKHSIFSEFDIICGKCNVKMNGDILVYEKLYKADKLVTEDNFSLLYEVVEITK